MRRVRDPACSEADRTLPTPDGRLAHGRCACGWHAAQSNSRFDGARVRTQGVWSVARTSGELGDASRREHALLFRGCVAWRRRSGQLQRGECLPRRARYLPALTRPSIGEHPMGTVGRDRHGDPRCRRRAASRRVGGQRPGVHRAFAWSSCAGGDSPISRRPNPRGHASDVESNASIGGRIPTLSVGILCH